MAPMAAAEVVVKAAVAVDVSRARSVMMEEVPAEAVAVLVAAAQQVVLVEWVQEVPLESIVPIHLQGHFYKIL